MEQKLFAAADREVAEVDAAVVVVVVRLVQGWQEVKAEGTLKLVIMKVAEDQSLLRTAVEVVVADDVDQVAGHLVAEAEH